MGACATKPKVQKDAEAPVAPPEQPLKEVAAAETGAAAVPEAMKVEEAVLAPGSGVDEEKKVVEREVALGGDPGEAKQGDTVTEVAPAADDDDQSDKRKSLSHLFKENEGRKESTEADKAPAELEGDTVPLVQESVVTEKAKDEPSAETLKEEIVVSEKPTIPEKQEQVVAEKPVDVPLAATDALAAAPLKQDQALAEKTDVEAAGKQEPSLVTDIPAALSETNLPGGGTTQVPDETNPPASAFVDAPAKLETEKPKEEEAITTPELEAKVIETTEPAVEKKP